MKKSTSWIILALIVVVLIVIGVKYKESATSNGGFQVNYDLKEGSYFDENGNVLGACTGQNVKSPDGIGYSSYTKFYDSAGNLVGSCSSYNGPGSSGWKGGCDEDLFENGLGTKIENQDSTYYGRVIPKYVCMIE